MFNSKMTLSKAPGRSVGPLNHQLSCGKLSSFTLPALAAVALAISGCSFQARDFRTANSDAAQLAFVQDGSIAVSRPMPQSASPDAASPGSVFAFAPALRPDSGAWLSISRPRGEITFMEGRAELFTVKAEGLESLPSGTFSLLHKQREATWYAPDTYFETRELDLPQDHSKDRFLKGALGEYALFLNPELPIHCGPAWLGEIGGARMEAQDLSRVYYRLALGAPVVVE